MKKHSSVVELPYVPAPLKPLNTNQERYIKSIKTNTITFGIGSAGTGKSYIAASMAADMLKSRKIDKIIVTRPAVEAGEKLGFLPGFKEEKFEVYLDPVKSIFEERLGKSQAEYLIKRNIIEGKPMAYLRGQTFKNAFVLLDEAQNVSPGQMYLFLTRIGENCKVVVDGDVLQKDIPGRSGLQDAIDKLDNKLNDCKFIYFTIDDVVRSGIVRGIMELYAEHNN
jgi:phosphate starvation-inducible PhoH-like protein